MKYDFPIIYKIDDVLPAIEGRDEFVVSDKDGITYINYVVIKPDTFKIIEGDERNSYIRRECRGIAFRNSDGLVISRPFHKFFNLNERECSTDEIVMDKMCSQPYTFYDKKDGSMVRPIIQEDGTFAFATKMGVTDVAAEVNTLFYNNVFTNQDYNECLFLTSDIASLLQTNLTPIFEYISPSNQIVLKYREPKLVLLAIRNNVSGRYVNPYDFNSLQVLTNYMCDDHTDTLAYAGTGLKLHESVNFLRDMENSEGAVLRFSDGHMVKIKADWYVRLHKTKDAVSSERKIVDLVINQGVDDLIPILLKEDKENVLDIQDWFWSVYDQKVESIQYLYDEMRTKYGDDRGAFAREQLKSLHPFDGRLIFSLWDGRDAGKVLMDMIQGHLSTEKKWDEMSDFLNL